jgi:hypothetical protein
VNDNSLRSCRDCQAKIRLLPNHKGHLIPVEVDVESFLIDTKRDDGEQVRVFTKEKVIVSGRRASTEKLVYYNESPVIIDGMKLLVTGHRLHKDICQGRKSA